MYIVSAKFKYRAKYVFVCTKVFGNAYRVPGVSFLFLLFRETGVNIRVFSYNTLYFNMISRSACYINNVPIIILYTHWR